MVLEKNIFVEMMKQILESHIKWLTMSIIIQFALSYSSAPSLAVSAVKEVNSRGQNFNGYEEKSHDLGVRIDPVFHSVYSSSIS